MSKKKRQKKQFPAAGASSETASSPLPQSQESNPGRTLVCIALIILCGFLAYHNSFQGEFVFDDFESISENLHIRKLWPLSEAMSFKLWDTATTVDCRPLLSLSFALNYRFARLEPFGYHVVNLLIHLGAALLLFAIVRWIMRWYTRADACAPALVTALLWVVHPLQTQSVTYLVQRAESQAALFFLLGFYWALRGFEAEAAGKRKWPWFTGAVLAGLIGIGTKEILIMLPVVVALYDYMFVSASPKQMLRRHWGLYAGLCLTWVYVGSIQFLIPSANAAVLKRIGPLQYALTQPEVILHYLRLAFWPHPLVMHYDWPRNPEPIRVALATLVLLIPLAVTIRGIWRRRWYGFAGAWFFANLLPTCTFYPLMQIAQEHRMYLALAAPVFLVVLGLHRLLLRYFGTGDGASLRPAGRAVAVGLTLAAGVALGWTTSLRNEVYKSELAIWRNDVQYRPETSTGHNNLGKCLLSEGKVEEAILHFQRAIALKKDFEPAYLGMANAMRVLGRYEEAIAWCRKAIELFPEYDQAISNLASMYQETGQPARAIEPLESAMRIHPYDPTYPYNLGNAYLQLQQNERAAEFYRKALALDPEHARAHNNLGVVLRGQGRMDEAIRHYQMAVKVDPDYVDARLNLASSLMQTGRKYEAGQHCRYVLQLDPGNELARQGIEESER